MKASQNTAPTVKRTRRKKVLALLLALLLALMAVGGYTYWRTSKVLNSIKRDKSLLSEEKRSKPSDPASGQPLNYLLLGSDTRGEGDKGRSDSLMVLHVPQDRSKAYLVSLPRDLYVKIPGYENKRKINAAYELGGAQLTTKTVEDLLGITINHVALVDFNGFIKLVNTLGGVTIDNPYEGCDTSQKVCWRKGRQTLNNERALQYVRWRHGLPNGDITRGENQQRVMKAIVAKTLSAGTLTGPWKLNTVIEGMGKHVTVDDTLTNDYIRALLLNMRMTSSEDLRTVTFPITGYMTHSTWGDVDLVDKKRLAELRTAFQQGTLEVYWTKHRNDPVAGAATMPETAVSKSL